MVPGASRRRHSGDGSWGAQRGRKHTIERIWRFACFALLAMIALAGILVAPRAALIVVGPEVVATRVQPAARGGPQTLRGPWEPEELESGGDALVVPASAPEPTLLATPRPTPAPTPTFTPAPTPPPATAPPATAPPATAPPVTPPPAPVRAAGSTSDAELRTLALMNASRAQGGLAPYALDAGVSQVARGHSAAEAAAGYVYHDGPDGTALSRNRPACGSGWWSENTGRAFSNDVSMLHREFMAEPWAPINHRTNIMDRSFTRVGIGAVQGRDAVYLTVVFCR